MKTWENDDSIPHRLVVSGSLCGSRDGDAVVIKSITVLVLLLGQPQALFDHLVIVFKSKCCLPAKRLATMSRWFNSYQCQLPNSEKTRSKQFSSSVWRAASHNISLVSPGKYFIIFWDLSQKGEKYRFFLWSVSRNLYESFFAFSSSLLF